MKNAILLVLSVSFFSACGGSDDSKPSTNTMDMGGAEVMAGASSEMAGEQAGSPVAGEMAGEDAGEMTSMDMGMMDDMTIEGGSEESADMAIEGGSTEMAGAEG
jgi:hypothetical protein